MMSRKKEFSEPTLQERLDIAIDAVKYYSNLKFRFELDELFLKHWKDIVLELTKRIKEEE
jgi:hypothetical protein